MTTAEKIKIEGDTLSYPVWVQRGGMIYRRDDLMAHDPDQTYNFLKANGVIPEDFGIMRPGEENRLEKFLSRVLAECRSQLNPVLVKDIEALLEQPEES